MTESLIIVAVECWDTASVQANKAEANVADARLSRLVTSDILHLNVRMPKDFPHSGHSRNSHPLRGQHLPITQTHNKEVHHLSVYEMVSQCQSRVNSIHHGSAVLLWLEDIWNKIILFYWLPSCHFQTDLWLLALPAGKWPSLSAPCLVVISPILLLPDRFSLWESRWGSRVSVALILNNVQSSAVCVPQMGPVLACYILCLIKV